MIIERDSRGHYLHPHNHFILCTHWRSRKDVREPAWRRGVNGLYLLVGLIAIGLLVYLVFALLKPEWFG